MEWMLMRLKRYADFSGRSRRKEYWMSRGPNRYGEDPKDLGHSSIFA